MADTAAAEPEVDIYGETEPGDVENFLEPKTEANGGEGPTEEELNNEDLYDAVLASGTTETTVEEEEDIELTTGSGGTVAAVLRSNSAQSSASAQSSRKHSCYVGNMTWWTTDQDVTEAARSVNIDDLVEVKFYENRANGQSKGFALLSFRTESSVRDCFSRFPTVELHGQHPVVLPYKKESLMQFENATKKSEPPKQDRSGGRLGGGGGGNDLDCAEAKGAKFLGTIRIAPVGGQQQMRGMGPPIGAPHGPMMGPPGMGPYPPGMPGMGMPPQHAYGMGPGPRPMYSTAPGMPPQAGGAGGMPQMNMPPGMAPPSGRPPTTGIPPPTPNRPPPGFPAPPGNVPQSQGVVVPSSLPPPRVGSLPPTIPTNVPPGSHINPNFYPQAVLANQGGQGTGQGPPNASPYGQPMHQHQGHGQAPEQLSEPEFEEIMNRNKTVSSSAISRAVSDAAAGEYASAIETLVTAISLIRQSKVSHDDRCKILISSLQDTLHGIEAKSYGNSAKDRVRDRSRSREREMRRKRRDRSRSRSRERYRDEYSPPRSTRRHREAY